MAKFEYSIRSKDETKAGVESAKSGLRGLEDSMQSINKVARLLMGAGAIAGIVSLFKNIAHAAGECEQAFAKLHPEFQNMAGSMEQWNRASEGLKAAMGGLISSALSPFRASLVTVIESLTEAINKTNDLKTALALLTVSKSPEAAKYLSDITTAQAKITELQKQRATVVTSISTAELIGGAWAASGTSASASNPVTKLNKATEEWDAKLKESQENLDKLVAKALAAVTPKPTPATGAGASSSDTALGWLLGPSTGYQAQGMSAWERGNLRFEQMVNDYEVATEKITYSLERLPQELIAEFEAADLLAMANAGAGQYAGGLPPEATAAAAVIAADPIMAAILPFIEQIQSITMLLDPWGTILKSAFDILAPMIDSILAPLAGIFVILGQTLGAVLVPILKWIMPVIQWLGEAFVWLYNNAILPIGNAFIGLFTVLGALGQLIFYIVTFQWGKIGGIKWAPATESLLQPISVGSLGAAGTTAIAGAGATTTYSSGRDITVNVVVNSQVITGDGGFRELALMLNREIENAMALGVA